MSRLGTNRRRLLGAAVAAVALAGCGGSPVPAQQNYGTIRGRVTDATTGGPVAGAIITVDTTLVATSGTDGTYRISIVPPGPYTLTVQPPSGYGPPNLPPSLASGSVQASETATVDIALPKPS